MSSYFGDFALGAVVRIPWATNGSNGAAITRSVNGSIRVYKDNGTSERTSSAGITDTEDFDTVTGAHHLNIDLADNTDAGFYVAGHDYEVLLQGATIDGQTVNAWLGAFSIQNRVKAGAKRGVALSNFLFFMQDFATLGAKTGLVNADFTKQITKDAGSPAAIAGTITEVNATTMPGFYRVSLTATELDATVVALYFIASGAMPVGLTLLPAA